MTDMQADALAFCRARSRPLYDVKAGEFLGTASAVSPTSFLTCCHCVASQHQVSCGGEIVPIRLRLPGLDLALLSAAGRKKRDYFVVASESARLNEEVIAYGYRVRDGNLTDVALIAEVGSLSERRLATLHDPQYVIGFKRRNLIEPGMSGGVILRASSFELLGYIAGYDELEGGERMDDVAVLLSTAVQDIEVRRNLTFSYQHRATFVNMVRRLVSLEGFVVSTECLGAEAGLDECFVCTRGHGAFKSTVLVVLATWTQMRSATALQDLYNLATARAEARPIAPDKTIVVVDNDCADYSYLHFVVPANQLSPMTPEDAIRRPDVDARYDTRLVGGVFLPRHVIAAGHEEPRDAVLAIADASRGSVRCTAITGPVGAGKKALLRQLRRVFKERDLSANVSWPEFHEVNIGSDGESNFSLPRPGDVVLWVTDFDKLWTAGQSVQAVRGLKHIFARMVGRQGDCCVLISMSGPAEQASTVLSSLLPGHGGHQDNFLVYKLLPMAADAMKQALTIVLGSAEGDAWWNTVISSQEIFQIAQWPNGLAVLLDRVVQAAWTHHRASQVEVIGALINGYLSGLGGQSQRIPPSATISFLVEIAKEVNATQNMHVPLERARELYAAVAPQGHRVQHLHSVAMNDVVVPGLLSQCIAGDAVAFDSPVFLHYLLALAIKASVGALELSTLNPLYHRRLPVALLKDVVQLGVNPDSLWELIHSTRDKSAAEVGFVGGNCVSLLRLQNADFQKRQMERCDLRGGILAGCNLSGANFSDASLIDVGLANATIKDTNFSGADLDRADLKTGCTVYSMAPFAQGMFVATSIGRLLWCDLAQPWSPSVVEITGFHDAVFDVAVSDKDGLVVAGGQDGTLRGWDAKSLEPRFVLRGHFSDVRSVALVGKRVVSGSVDGNLNIWEPWSASLVNSRRLCGGEIWSIAALNTDTVAVLCDKGHLHLISLTDTKANTIYTLPRGHARRLSVDRVSDRILVGIEEGVWKLDWTSLRSSVVPVPHPFIRVAFRTNSGSYLLGGAYGKIIATNLDFSDAYDVCSGMAAIGSLGTDAVVTVARRNFEALKTSKTFENDIQRGLQVPPGSAYKAISCVRESAGDEKSTDVMGTIARNPTQGSTPPASHACLVIVLTDKITTPLA